MYGLYLTFYIYKLKIYSIQVESLGFLVFFQKTKAAIMRVTVTRNVSVITGRFMVVAPVFLHPSRLCIFTPIRKKTHQPSAPRQLKLNDNPPSTAESLLSKFPFPPAALLQVYASLSCHSLTAHALLAPLCRRAGGGVLPHATPPALADWSSCGSTGPSLILEQWLIRSDVTFFNNDTCLS